MEGASNEASDVNVVCCPSSLRARVGRRQTRGIKAACIYLLSASELDM